MKKSNALWLFDATRHHSGVPAVCEGARRARQPVQIFHRSEDRLALQRLVPAHDPLIQLLEATAGGPAPIGALQGIPLADGAEVIFLSSTDIDWAHLQALPPFGRPRTVQPIVTAEIRSNPGNFDAVPAAWIGWRATGDLLPRLLQEPATWKADGVAWMEALQRWPDPPRWQSVPLLANGADDFPRSSPPLLTPSSSVLAVVSFFGCEEWLNASLASLMDQTRPPDNIVVVDDGSPELPLALLEPFPNVTLLSTPRNLGPERILNNIIKATDYDAYMVQDPDDWSACDRLELLLRGAEESGAGVIGSGEFRVDHKKDRVELWAYTPDAGGAMAQGPGLHLLHCASLYSRRVALAVGGFDENMSLAADTEFITRAWSAAPMINIPSFAYYRRARAGSLTTTPSTGFGSSRRMIEHRFIQIRASRNLELLRSGGSPKFFVEQKQPVSFVYHQGPHLWLHVPAPGEPAGLSTISGFRHAAARG